MKWLTQMNKAIAALVVPLVTYLISIGTLPPMQDGMDPETLATMISAVVTAVVVWLVPNMEAKE